MSGRGLCVRPASRPESSTESGVSECGREALILRRPWPTKGWREKIDPGRKALSS